MHPLMRRAAAVLAVALAGGGLSCGGNDDGGDVGTGPTPPPSSINVTVGNILFRSDRNGTENPAVDTVAVGGTVTWTWVDTGPVPHSVRSQGSPAFTSSEVLTGDGQTHSSTFSAAGTYQYDCEVHPGSMTGTIVVR